MQIDSGKQTLVIFRTKYSVIASAAWQSPGREPYKTNAVFLSKKNINEKFFSGKKDFVREKY